MFSFKRFCDVGNHLSNFDEESFSRSAISRYYYSIFCCVRMYLILVCGEFEFAKNKDVHRKICDRLIRSGDNTEMALGLKLEELRQLRNDADYDWNLDQHYFREHLEDVKINSEIAHQYLNALNASPPFEI